MADEEGDSSLATLAQAALTHSTSTAPSPVPTITAAPVPRYSVVHKAPVEEWREWPSGDFVVSFDETLAKWQDGWSWRNTKGKKIAGTKRIARACQGILLCRTEGCPYVERPFVHSQKLQDQIEKSRCQLCDGVLHLQSCDARSVVVKDDSGRITAFEHTGAHYHEKPGQKRGAEARTVEPGTPMPPSSYPSVLHVPARRSPPAAPPTSAKRMRFDDSHRSSPPAPTPTTVASRGETAEPMSPLSSTSNVPVHTRPPLLDPCLLYDSFFQPGTSAAPPTSSGVPPISPRPVLLRPTDLSRHAAVALGDALLPGPRVPLSFPSARVPSASASEAGEEDDDADDEEPEEPWAEMERFLGGDGPRGAAKMLYELGCVSVERLCAHDPVMLKGFMDEHLVVTDKLLAFEASMILVRVARHRRAAGLSDGDVLRAVTDA